MVIGITGNSGAGKSVLCAECLKEGFLPMDADEMVHTLYREDEACIQEITEAFGTDVIGPDGKLNRKRLGELVFSDEDKKKKLEGIVFPRVLKKIRETIAQNANRDILLDAPMLFESGADALCDVTVAVLADEDIRLRRICERDGISLKEAKIRLRAQKQKEYYLARAQKVLYNNEELPSFVQQARTLLQKVVSEENIHAKNQN